MVVESVHRDDAGFSPPAPFPGETRTKAIALYLSTPQREVSPGPPILASCCCDCWALGSSLLPLRPLQLSQHATFRECYHICHGFRETFLSLIKINTDSSRDAVCEGDVALSVSMMRPVT